MIHRTRMPNLEQTYELFDDPRYLESKGPDHEAYSAMANRLQNFHISPEKWPKPEPFRLGRPLAPRLPVGAGGVNHPHDVAELSDGLLSLGGLGLSGWLPRTHVPSSKLNAAIVGFQRLNNLKPDGLVNPNGPTIGVPPPGRPITARGMGDEALAQSRAEQAQFEAELEAARRADDPNYDVFGGRRRYERNHIDDMLDEQEAEACAQLDREALAGLDSNYAMIKAGYRPNDQAVWGAMGVPGKAFSSAVVAAEQGKLDDDTGIAFGMVSAQDNRPGGHRCDGQERGMDVRTGRVHERALPCEQRVAGSSPYGLHEK